MSVTRDRIGDMLSAWKRCLLQCEDYVEVQGDACNISGDLLKEYPDFNDRWAQIEKERDAILAELDDYRLEKELKPVCCEPTEYFFTYYNTPVSLDRIDDILHEIENKEKEARYQESLYDYD